MTDISLSPKPLAKFTIFLGLTTCLYGALAQADDTYGAVSYSNSHNTSYSAGQALPLLSPDQIAADVEARFDPLTGRTEYIARDFDPFENEGQLVGSARLRSASTGITRDGFNVAGGAYLDISALYSANSRDPYDSRGLEHAVYMNGQPVDVMSYDVQTLECEKDITHVTYDSGYYSGASYGYVGGIYRLYPRYRGHSHYYNHRDRIRYGAWRGLRQHYRHHRGYDNRYRDHNYRDRDREERRDYGGGENRRDADIEALRRRIENREHEDGDRFRRGEDEEGRISTRNVIRHDRLGEQRLSNSFLTPPPVTPRPISNGTTSERSGSTRERSDNERGDREYSSNRFENGRSERNSSIEEIRDRDRENRVTIPSSSNRFTPPPSTSSSRYSAPRTTTSRTTTTRSTTTRTVPTQSTRSRPSTSRFSTPPGVETSSRSSTRSVTPSRSSTRTPTVSTPSRSTPSRSTTSTPRPPRVSTPRATPQRSTPSRSSSSNRSSSSSSRPSPSRSTTRAVNRSFERKNPSNGRSNRYYPSSYTNTHVSSRCVKEERLTLHIPAERLEAARFDGLSIVLLDRNSQDVPLYIPPNYIEGFRRANPYLNVTTGYRDPIYSGPGN